MAPADIVAEIIEEETPLVIDPELAHQLWNEIRRPAGINLPAAR